VAYGFAETARPVRAAAGTSLTFSNGSATLKKGGRLCVDKQPG
jgi:hypothetical protein